MLRTLFLFLCLIFSLGFSPSQAIEIYASGHEYASFEEYRLRKGQSLQLNQKGLSDKTRHKLYLLSVENGMIGVLQDFYQSLAQPDPQLTHSISSEQLQAAIQQVVTASNVPKLLISQPGKVRIVALTAEDSSKDQP